MKKTFELTWEDIKKIVNIADKMHEEYTYEELRVMGEKNYYETILNKFFD